MKGDRRRYYSRETQRIEFPFLLLLFVVLKLLPDGFKFKLYALVLLFAVEDHQLPFVP